MTEKAEKDVAGFVFIVILILAAFYCLTLIS